MSQRLVRLICSKCKTADIPPQEQLKQMGIEFSQKESHLSKGRGCLKCKRTGCHGRTGIFEWVTMTEAIRKFIFQRSSEQDLKTAIAHVGEKDLKGDGFEKALQGITTLEEVLTVTQGE